MDIALLESIFPFKRESRMARDNSEDALTWNVFRFLDQAKVLGAWLEELMGTPVKNPRLKFWSYCPGTLGTWPLLDRARQVFGEMPRRDSEPDLIVEADDAIFWIEAKFLAGNETTPSKPKETKKYLTGGDHWFDNIFTVPFSTVAVDKKFYELARFWLLGSWGAAQAGKRFTLVNLVREQMEPTVERDFGGLICDGPERRFKRATWEDIYRFIASQTACDGGGTVLDYLAGKSAGYSPSRHLVQAFSLPSSASST